ncbi:MAG: PilZ domain-containing protein [Deltaproteobacteria bacterium]|nr:PilZ domain-containing protein [Deltaproteobacteria bacterium]
MADSPTSGLAATITLKFTDSASLAESLATYSGQHGTGGLCIQVIKYYEIGDQLLVHLDFGEQPLPIRAVVAWRKPGYIGVRFQPATAEENKTFGFIRKLLGDSRNAAVGAPPPVADVTKPFAE